MDTPTLYKLENLILPQLYAVYMKLLISLSFMPCLWRERELFLDSCHFPHKLKCCPFIWEVTEKLKLDKVVFYTFQNAVSKLSQTEVKQPD